jgi:hypothetical protein
MAKQNNLNKDAAVELIERFPKAATRTLARMLYKNNIALFKDEEDARQCLRYHRGEKGEYSRKQNAAEKKRNAKVAITIPESWSKSKEVFTIPEKYKLIGVMSDSQAPFHDVRACVAFVEHLKSIAIDCLFLNGDMIDFYGISSFERDPRKRNFKDELYQSQLFLSWLKSQFPDIPVYYSLDANHELRYEKYMMHKAPELLSTDLFMVEDLLMLHDIGIIPLRGYDHVLMGKLPVVHGHTIFRGFMAPVVPARAVYMKMNKSCLAAHVHKVSQYPWVDMDGKTHCTWTTGCFMSLNVEYNPHGNNYVHGGAVVEILDKQGNFRVDNKMIIDGVIH